MSLDGDMHLIDVEALERGIAPPCDRAEGTGRTLRSLGSTRTSFWARSEEPGGRSHRVAGLEGLGEVALWRWAVHGLRTSSAPRGTRKPPTSRSSMHSRVKHRDDGWSRSTSKITAP